MGHCSYWVLYIRPRSFFSSPNESTTESGRCWTLWYFFHIHISIITSKRKQASFLILPSGIFFIFIVTIAVFSGARCYRTKTEGKPKSNTLTPARAHRQQVHSSIAYSMSTLLTSVHSFSILATVTTRIPSSSLAVIASPLISSFSSFPGGSLIARSKTPTFLSA
jgi:hypothetical protein